jgi:predicted adenylyl cyclase CyaB
MCVEIEAKLKVDSLSEIEQKLAELGARFVGEQLQTDYFFDNAKSMLIKEDKCLRLRRQLVAKNESCFLTYKGAQEKSNLKKRQEIEFEIIDSDSAHKLLLALGYEQVLIVDKKRRLWQFGDCDIALDTLPLLGDFVEIEGPDEEKIAYVKNNLGLTDVPHILKSYASMLREQLQQLGQ